MLVRKLKPYATIVTSGPARVYVVETNKGHVTVGITAKPDVNVTFEPPRIQGHLEPIPVDIQASPELD